jgi:DNA-binding transcriptional LysR family regulator
MLVIVASPAFRHPPRDSFPLSDYPMFSHGLASPEFTLSHALGVRADESTVPLSPMVSSANREVLQSMMTIHNAVADGRAISFCHEVAARVAESSDLDDVARVRIVTSRFDSVAYFESGPEPLERTLHAECAVAR